MNRIHSLPRSEAADTISTHAHIMNMFYCLIERDPDRPYGFRKANLIRDGFKSCLKNETGLWKIVVDFARFEEAKCVCAFTIYRCFLNEEGMFEFPHGSKKFGGMCSKCEDAMKAIQDIERHVEEYYDGLSLY